MKLKQLFLLLLISSGNSVWTQDSLKMKLLDDVIHMDSLLFDAGFNRCEVEQFERILTDDFEFVHDRGGTQDKTEFLSVFKEHICSNRGVRPIREALYDTFEVFPLYNEGVLYGVLQDGVHEFYVQELTKEVYQTSVARFTHLWLLEESQWRLSRVFSYDHQEPEAEAVRALTYALNISEQYLLRTLNQDGSFLYRINTDPSISVVEKYNVLRHAGTVYALCSQYKQQASAPLLEGILRAGSFLQSETIGRLEEGDAKMAIWSLPEMNGSGEDKQAKLGGTGLGLVALLEIEKINPGYTKVATLNALGEFLLYMQKEDGSFYSKYIPSKGGFQTNWESLYYPGEAALALSMLYEFDGQRKWIEAANASLSYLANKRKGKTDIPADHWALIATEVLMSIESEDANLVSRSLLIDHAVQICKVILQTQIHDSQNSRFVGGFVADGRTTPTATRLEGLLAARKFIAPEHDLIAQIDQAIEMGIDFLYYAQIKDGLYEGGMPRAVSHLDNKDSSFNERVTEVRIDYVQHAMSAFCGYLDLLQSAEHD